MFTDVSDRLGELIKGTISEQQYHDKITKQKMEDDFEYLRKSGDIESFSKEFESNIYKELSLTKLRSLISKRLKGKNESIYLSTELLIKEIEKRYYDTVNTIEDFFDNFSSPTEVDGYEDITDDDEVKLFWWSTPKKELAFGEEHMAATMCAFNNKLSYQSTKINEKKCKEEKKMPHKMANFNRSFNLKYDQNFRSKYSLRGTHSNRSDINMKQISEKTDDEMQELILINTIFDHDTSIINLPDKVAKKKYKNNKDDVLESAITNTKKQKRLKELDVDSNIEDKIQKQSFKRLKNKLSNRKRITSKGINSYSAYYKKVRIKSDLENLSDKQLNTIWLKEFEHHDSSGEKVRKSLTDIFTDTALYNATYNADLSGLNDTQKSKIVKAGIKTKWSKTHDKTISLPGFNLSRGVLDNLTALQLAKFIKMLRKSSRSKLKDVADRKFFKKKMSKKIFKGDERAKDAINIIQDVFNDNEDKSEGKSTNKKKKTQEGIMQIKAEKSYTQLNKWVSSFDSYKDMVDSIKETDEELLNKGVFDLIWDNINYSSGSLRYKKNKKSKLNFKIVKQLDELNFSDFSIPEVEEDE